MGEARVSHEYSSSRSKNETKNEEFVEALLDFLAFYDHHRLGLEEEPITLNRHRFATEIIKLWLNDATPDEFVAHIEKGSRLFHLRTSSPPSCWDMNFRRVPGFWISYKVAERPGTVFKTPYEHMATHCKIVGRTMV